MILPPPFESEVEELAARFGAPLQRDVTLQNDGLFDPIGKRDRLGEVCMVVRRPSSKLLVAKKTFYPAGAYRLLTGGIHIGEAILPALLRETEEETGLQVEVCRFLAAVGYRHKHDDPAQPPIFSTFAFLIDEIGGNLECLDPHERLEDFREIAVDELLQMADFLDELALDASDEIQGRWRDWGRFRAIIHRAVWEALQVEQD